MGFLTKLNIDDDTLERFHSKYKFVGDCWLWTSTKNWKGYGRIHIKIKKKSYFSPQAHRLSYIIYKGTIPNKMTVHHKCHNKACVNPDHLEIKTNDENRLEGNCWSAKNARKTKCINGHNFSGNNLYTYYRNKSKRRGCKICRRNNVRKNRKKKNE